MSGELGLAKPWVEDVLGEIVGMGGRHVVESGFRRQCRKIKKNENSLNCAFVKLHIDVINTFPF